MAQYLAKFIIEVEVYEPFDIGKKGEVLYDENGKCNITDSKYNDIVSDALSIMEIDGCNCVSITKSEEV